ncbi:MAG: metal ABC transporter permease [Verrucomicrobiota bacterium]|nr:metal ABC transporter permease [Verrucomicrobiota bacterium]
MYARQIGFEDSAVIIDRVYRFFQWNDQSVIIVVLGSVLMGMSCGLIGSYVVTRRLSLFGDTLSHAVLPGIAVGFIWSGQKNNFSILVGAALAGFLGIACLGILERFTKVRKDSAMGIVLSAFYAVGICLLTRIQKLGFSEQAGLETYLFGQASALSREDISSLALTLFLIIFFITINYKQLLITGFDLEFSRSIKIPAELIQYCLWTLIAFCVISSLQLVGVILISALLVIPAVTASLLTQRMHHYLGVACMLGALAGFGGTFFSFLGSQLPTGPLIVLCSSTLFIIVLFFRPHKGIFIRWAHSRSQKHRIATENTLKAAFQVIEANGFEKNEVSLHEMIRKRGLGSAEAKRSFDSLIQAGLAFANHREDKNKRLPSQAIITLTPKGWEYACKIVRNHRLWELYLTNEAHYPPDHVHEDAEKIEHVIGEETVRKIEKLLKNPQTDPHGKLIPSIGDINSEIIPEQP